MDAEIKYTDFASDFAHYATFLNITGAIIPLIYDRASAILVKYIATMSLHTLISQLKR